MKHMGDDALAETSPDSGPVQCIDGKTPREQDVQQYSAKDAHELESKVQTLNSESSISDRREAIVSGSLEQVSYIDIPTSGPVEEETTRLNVLDCREPNEDIQLPSITGAPDVQVDLSADEVQMSKQSSIKDSIYEDSVPETGSLSSASNIRVSADQTMLADSTRPRDSNKVENVTKEMAVSEILEIDTQPESVSPSYDVVETESGEDSASLAGEVTAPSAHRPTTLMITSNSNESTDDAECTANDLTKLGREDDIPKELKEEANKVEVEEVEEQAMGELVASERLPGIESGAVPRPERPARPAPRSTTLVKVKVEKRPVGSHLLVRERSVHEHQPTVHVPSVEEEVRGLMQEVKEATSQIKQEVKELRQADTPTPDTPTPLREFKEFLNREEEQELERLPTIKEMCRESEEDASGNTGGEHLRGHEHLRLELDVPTLGRPIPVQAVQRSADDSSHPDSGYSTLEGYYAVGVDPYHTSKYTSCSEPVPEGSPSEPSVKSELESPSSLVDSSDLSPVDSVGSNTSPSSETQGKSKFKSFIKKVRKITSKGLPKTDNKKTDRQGDKSPDIAKAADITVHKAFQAKNWETSAVVMSKEERLSSVDRNNESWVTDISDQLSSKGRDYKPFNMEKIRKGDSESLATVADVHASEVSLEKSAVTDSPETDTAIIESPVSVASFSVSPIAEVHDITESHEVRMALHEESAPDDQCSYFHDSNVKPIPSHDIASESDSAREMRSQSRQLSTEHFLESPTKESCTESSLICQLPESSFRVPQFVEPFVIDSVASDRFHRGFESDTIIQVIHESAFENVTKDEKYEAAPVDILAVKRERFQKTRTHSLEFDDGEPMKSLPPSSPILLPSGVDNVRFEYEDDEDDDVDLPSSDVVKILETVIELDEPEDDEYQAEVEERSTRKNFIGVMMRGTHRDIGIIEEEPSQPMGQMFSPEIDSVALLEQQEEVEDGDSVRSVIADSEFLSIEELLREKDFECGGIDIEEKQLSEADFIVDPEQVQLCVAEALIHSHEMQVSLVESIVDGDDMKLTVAESLVPCDDLQLSITETLADSDEMQVSVAEAVVDSDEIQQLSLAETIVDSDDMQMSVTETVVDSEDMLQSVSGTIVDNEDTQLFISQAIIRNDEVKLILEKSDAEINRVTDEDVGNEQMQLQSTQEAVRDAWLSPRAETHTGEAYQHIDQEEIDADIVMHDFEEKKQKETAHEKEKRITKRRGFYKPPRPSGVDDEENKFRMSTSTEEMQYVYDPTMTEDLNYPPTTSLHSAIVEALSMRYFTDSLGKNEPEIRSEECQAIESDLQDEICLEQNLTGLTLPQPGFARGTETIHEFSEMPALPLDVLKVTETVCQVEELEGMDEVHQVKEIETSALDLATGKESIHVADDSEEFDKVVSIVTVTSSSESDSDQKVFLIDEVHNISEVESPEEDVTADIVSDFLTEDMEAYATESDESMADMGIVEISETVCLVDEIQEMFDTEQIGEILPLDEDLRNVVEIIHQVEEAEHFSAVKVNLVTEEPLSHTLKSIEKYPCIKEGEDLSATAEAMEEDVPKITSEEAHLSHATLEQEDVEPTPCHEIKIYQCGSLGCEDVKGGWCKSSPNIQLERRLEREKETPPDDTGGVDEIFTDKIQDVREGDSWLHTTKIHQGLPVGARQGHSESIGDESTGYHKDIRETECKMVEEVLQEDCDDTGKKCSKIEVEVDHSMTNITRVEKASETQGIQDTDRLLEQGLASDQQTEIVYEESLKLGVLDRVSEELKAMINNLEQNLAAGTSKDVKITPILARLEQLEQEVANLTPTSEEQESSIPDLSLDMQPHDLVSSPQASATEERGRLHAEDISSGNNRSLAVNMPVGMQTETTTLGVPGGQSPMCEMNGQDIQEALTDVEDLHLDGEQSPLPKQKMLLVPEKDTGGVTDTEDLDFSGDEDDIIQEKTNLPTIQDLGVLPEPVREVINLTEGYARDTSPLLLSDSDSDAEDVQKRHKKNIRKVDKMSDLQVPAEEEPEGVTDVEDMVASGDEVEETQIEVEDSLPDHYLDQGEGVSNHEQLKAVAPKPKIFKQKEDSSDDEKPSKKQVRRRSKASLTVKPREEGATDVEDLVFSDLGDNEEKVPQVKKYVKEKVRCKKQVRRKSLPKVQAGTTLTTPTGDASGVTDTEILSGDNDDDDEDEDEDDTGLFVPESGIGTITDTEDMEDSGAEDIEDMVAAPLEKKDVAIIPEPHAEKILITETEEAPQKESEGETDEEAFQLDENEDEKPLMPRKKVISEPIEIVTKENLEVEEPCEAAITDTEDFDMEDKEEEEVINDIKSRIPEEGEIHTIQELEADYGEVTKKEMIRDTDAELKELIKEAEAGGLTLQEALHCEALTDVEDLDDDDATAKQKVQRAPPRKVKKEEGETDEESVDESDIEEEIRKPPPRRTKQRGKRLPLVPQVSEVRFVETEQGPLSIIITPENLDNNPNQVVKDQVTGVVFLETDDKEATTDVEDLQSSDEEVYKRRASILNAPQVITEPATDTEDFDVDVTEVDRPLSPLPPDLNYNVLSSPKRELIHIKEDKYGVPQVSIRKLSRDELLVSDIEDLAMTDTEDIEVSEAEALRLIGATLDSTSDFELPDSGVIEVSSVITQKKQTLNVDADEEGGSTDIEELEMTKKSKRKGKSKSRLEAKAQGEDSHTDIELLSDQDDKGLIVRTESPKGVTDTEDFVTSETEDLDVPERDDAPTPDVIKNAAIKKIIILKEGPEGVTHTEEASVVQAPNRLFVEDEPEGITDVEDMEASGAEDDDIPEHPGVDLPEHEYSSVDISEKTSIPKDRNEAKHIKDNLLLPEDNYNNLTDVESLDGGEGNRCASNTRLLSGQQLTYAVESCIVEELPYTCIPLTDPSSSANAGLSLENDPFCSELTNPLVVEAELEQVYYHAPQEEPHQSEIELTASDGCVVRKRQVVASMCQAREIRRFWSQGRNSPLQQSELSEFATPTVHKKGFKTILYLEQPNLLDTISISDTLCDSSYFKNERLMDFDSSSIESFDDHFSYIDSDIVTVVDRFNQERGSSFDDLPSPHLSSIGSSGVVDSLFDSPCLSPQPDGVSGRTSSQDRRHMYEPCTGSNSPVFTSSPDIRRQHDARSTHTPGRDYGETHFVFHSGENVANKMQNYSKQEVKNASDGQALLKHISSFGSPVSEMRGESEYIDNSTLSQPMTVSEIRKGPAYERHEGFTTECIGEYANKHYNVSAKESVEENILSDNSGVSLERVKGYASEYIQSPQSECVQDLPSEYEKIPATSCLKTSPTGYIQRSITEWVVAHNNGRYQHLGHDEEPQTIHRTAFSDKEPELRIASNQVKPPASERMQYSSIDYRPIYVPKYQSPQRKDSITRKIMQRGPSPILQSREVTDQHLTKSFEDSGVHMHQTSGSFTASIDTEDERLMNLGDDSDRVSVADSVLGLEEQHFQDVDNQTGYRMAFSRFMMPTSSQPQKSELGSRFINKPKNEHSLVTAYPATVVPPQWYYTQPDSSKQEMSQLKVGHGKVLGEDTGDLNENSKDYAGVKGLIDQWEVIVQEEKRRSLPASPAVGRRILPPFEGKKKPGWNSETEGTYFTETEQIRVSSENLGQSHIVKDRAEELEGAVGGNVVEEVASVGDIIQQFEGRVGRLDKKSAHKQRLQRGSQSPASRSPSHPRQVATVKPLRESQYQHQKNIRSVADQHADHLETALASGFVPRVMESLSVTKSSQEAHEEDPPTHASVPYPEGEFYQFLLCKTDYRYSRVMVLVIVEMAVG